MQSIRSVLAFVVMGGFAVSALASDQPQNGRGQPDRAMLEKQFAEKLTGSALVGNFTTDGQPADRPLKPERYEISKARKVEGDTWEITARIKYGQIDVQVPIELDVLWAGDTPVMSLTDLRIPLMEGSFTARVLFYGDRYVGTWQHGRVGGHMFGHVERADAAEDAGRQAVSGNIVFNGQPLGGATIEFVPADGKGRAVTGKTDARGRFALKLPTGKYGVVIKSGENADAARRVPAKFSAVATSPLAVEVVEGVNVFDVELEF